MQTKTCNKCKETKVVEKFYKNNVHKDKLSSKCKECFKVYYNDNKEYKEKYDKQYRQDHKDEISKRNKKYRQDHREDILENVKNYYQNHKKERAEYNKRYRQRNKEEIAKYNKKYKHEHKIKILKQYKKYHQDHKEEIAKYNKKYKTNRYKTDINYKMGCVLRKRIRTAIKKQSGTKAFRSIELLGCTVEEAREHIESQFQDGMTWENYGYYGWHIDHIKPCASFDLTDPEQQKECFNYNNLQPLWAEDNLSKGDKLLD